MLPAEECKLPKLFSVSGYVIFFWSNDDSEPIHVHVCKGTPSPNSTKIWLTRNGGCIEAHNKSRIPQNELNELKEFISAQFFYICSEWQTHFKADKVKFYC